MKRLWILPLLLLIGCATVQAGPESTMTSTLPPISAPYISAPYTHLTPLQDLAGLITKLADNPLFKLANQDASDTLAWVNGPNGPTDALQKFRAQQCPLAVQLATADFQAKAAAFVASLNQIDASLTNANAQGPEIILFFTKLRYGSGPSLDPKAAFDQIKTDVFNRVSAVVDSCKAILPVRQLDQVAQLAGKVAGVVFTGGALGMLAP